MLTATPLRAGPLRQVILAVLWPPPLPLVERGRRSSSSSTKLEPTHKLPATRTTWPVLAMMTMMSLLAMTSLAYLPVHLQTSFRCRLTSFRCTLTRACSSAVQVHLVCRLDTRLAIPTCKEMPQQRTAR